jgi:hypothetical protein
MFLQSRKLCREMILAIRLIEILYVLYIIVKDITVDNFFPSVLYRKRALFRRKLPEDIEETPVGVSNLLVNKRKRYNRVTIEMEDNLIV